MGERRRDIRDAFGGVPKQFRRAKAEGKGCAAGSCGRGTVTRSRGCNAPPDSASSTGSDGA